MKICHYRKLPPLISSSAPFIELDSFEIKNFMSRDISLGCTNLFEDDRDKMESITFWGRVAVIGVSEYPGEMTLMVKSELTPDFLF